LSVESRSVLNNMRDHFVNGLRLDLTVPQVDGQAVKVFSLLLGDERLRAHKDRVGGTESLILVRLLNYRNLLSLYFVILHVLDSLVSPMVFALWGHSFFEFHKTKGCRLLGNIVELSPSVDRVQVLIAEDFLQNYFIYVFR